jgi:NAD-dependent DNA ligase
LFDSSFNDEVTETIDGVVYCSQSWLYPYDKTDNGKTNYGKYAWKPSNESSTTITSIVETRTKDGFIEFSVFYESVFMEGKNWVKCRIVPTSINRFIDKFGIGSTVTIILRDNISPYIKECEIPADGPFEPWNFPTHCSSCGTELVSESKKDSFRIRCPNDRCNATMVKLCADACKQMKIAKCADKTIEAFFTKNRIEHYSIYDLLTHARSPAILQFRRNMQTTTVQEFMKLTFPNIRGQKQFSKLLDDYEVSSIQIDKIINHTALVRSIAESNDLPFFARELARAFLRFK